MFIVGKNWSSLRNQLFIFDLLHAHRSPPIGGFMPCTTQTRFVFLYSRLPRCRSDIYDMSPPTNKWGTNRT
jgi:hypothetical protein